MPTEKRIELPFDSNLREQLSDRFALFTPREIPLNGNRHAAVAVVILDSDADEHGTDETAIDRIADLGQIPGTGHDELTGKVDGTAGGAAVLLTRRSAKLRAHARQWAFPGGRIDEGETPLEAARRELREEVDLHLTEAHLLGRLDDYETRSGYMMTPFVFWSDPPNEPVANPGEVESVHRIALTELQREDSPRFVDIPESDRPVIQVPIGGDLIHAPTGAILYQLRAVGLDGQAIRVHDYEQPVFAWS